MPRSALVFILCLFTTYPTFSEELTLRDLKSQAQVQLVPFPGLPGFFLVAWDKVPNKNPNGVLVFQKLKESFGSRYVTVGPGEPFSFFEPTARTRVEGARTFKFDFDLRDSSTTLTSTQDKPDPSAILKAYRESQGVSEPAEDKKIIDQYIDEQVKDFNHTCKAQMKFEIAPEGFSKKERSYLVKQLGGAVAGLTSVCLDPVYQKEISYLKKIILQYGGDNGLVIFRKNSQVLTIVVSEKTMNPRNQARAWALKSF